MRLLLAIILILPLLTGCPSVQPCHIQMASCDETIQRTAAGSRDWPAILNIGMPREIRTTAINAARGDIKAGKPRIAFTGGFASRPVGVSIDDFNLVKDLPRVPLPSGCTEPLLQQAGIYAEAYNKEILPYLKTHKPTQ
jgi:hypothetical protein